MRPGAWRSIGPHATFLASRSSSCLPMNSDARNVERSLSVGSASLSTGGRTRFVRTARARPSSLCSRISTPLLRKRVDGREKGIRNTDAFAVPCAQRKGDGAAASGARRTGPQSDPKPPLSLPRSGHSHARKRTVASGPPRNRASLGHSRASSVACIALDPVVICRAQAGGKTPGPVWFTTPSP